MKSGCGRGSSAWSRAAKQVHTLFGTAAKSSMDLCGQCVSRPMTGWQWRVTDVGAIDRGGRLARHARVTDLANRRLRCRQWLVLQLRWHENRSELAR